MTRILYCGRSDFATPREIRTIRNLTIRRPEGSGRYVPRNPSDRTELSYRDALAEANSSFFAGE
jgi:hypothetical protein